MSRTRDLVEDIRRRLASRSLMPGERLPSIRRYASAMGVSPSTVVEAYERLTAEGAIRSRPGSGFYVAGVPLALTASETAPKIDREIDPLWVSRQSLDTGANVLRPGCGWLPADWMPQDAIRRTLRKLAKGEDGSLADYGETQGSPALRGALARRFASEGLACPPDQILLTASGTQALDLIGRFLLQPGDTVLIDDPGYFNFQALLRAHRVKIVGVPYTPAGPDPERFAELVRTHSPKLYITNSAIQNPTGASLSPAVAHRILLAAAAYDVTIVEDDIFADFEPEPSPRLAALDGLDRVIRIGSFSKTLSASMRCGYIAAKPEWIDGLIDLQVATNFGGPSPHAAELVLGVLGDGSYRRHLGALRTRLAKRRKEAQARLEGLGLRVWAEPRGGFTLWCRLPDGQDAADLAKAALSDKLVLAPGNVFSVSQTASDLMRFNVTQLPPAAFDALKRLLQMPAG
ncbi:PLP-dependent aminotransferase family protein [Aureimonas ureilytica]|uniref:aminotransferase-like domain-containing protein n=1 Tax=Aureimonas ureilytica TaxID=401562 RepID=UPI003CEFC986